MAKRKTALVIGGAGFIGGHLVELLLREAFHIRLLDPAAERNPSFNRIELIKKSMLEKGVLDDAMEEVDYVFHLAALTHLWAKDKKQFDRINVDGTAAILKAARKQKVPKLVVTSTETILRGWNDANPFPITENDPLPGEKDMAGPYTLSKFKADKLVQKAAKDGLPVVSVYPTVPVGPGDYGLTAPTKMILDFLRGKTPAFYNAEMNFVAAEDVAMGHYLAALRGMPGERFILGGENLAMQSFLEKLERISGKKMPSKQIPYDLAYATAVMAELTADFITRKPPVASREAVRLVKNPSFVSTHWGEKRLNYNPGIIKNALGQTVRWLEEQNLLN